MQVYGLDYEADLHSPLENNERLTDLANALDTSLAQLIDEIFALFSTSYGSMQWPQFVQFSRIAPRVVDWLTELGTELRARFQALELQDDGSYGFEADGRPVAPYGAVLSDAMMDAAFTKHAGSGGENAVSHLTSPIAICNTSARLPFTVQHHCNTGDGRFGVCQLRRCRAGTGQPPPLCVALPPLRQRWQRLHHASGVPRAMADNCRR